jgi:hypothetical protein
VTFFANLYWVYDLSERALELEVVYQSEAVVVLVALVNVGLLAYTLTRMLPVLRDGNAGKFPNESPRFPRVHY